MRTWIALFRGINVSGYNILPMAALREALVSLGCENVRTYIQSGNVVFESAARSRASIDSKLGALIERHLGVAVTARNHRTVRKLVAMAAH